MEKEGKKVDLMAVATKAGEAIIDPVLINLKTISMKENSKDEQQQNSGSQHAGQDLKESGGMQNASANRGGTTDMDDEALTTGRRNASERGSGISTKNAVTGSDYDGQISSE
jgi:hypothetical protein